MNAVGIAAIVSGLVGAVVAVLTYWDQRHGASVRRRREFTEDLVRDSLASQLKDAFGPIDRRLVAMETDLGTVHDRLTGLETKMEPFWQLLAVNMARILHSPLPGRERVDYLLERFMDGGINAREADELRAKLTQIRDYEPGKPSPFPIYAGEQTAAAILLTTLELARKAAS